MWSRCLLPALSLFVTSAHGSLCPDSSTDPKEIALCEKIEKSVDEAFKNLQYPGLAIAVSRHGKMIYESYRGFADIEKGKRPNRKSLFRIGSITKTFLGTAIMQLRDQGKLKLDDPVENYIPEFKNIKYPYKGSPKITIRHLLTHTSGIVKHLFPPEGDTKIENLIASSIKVSQKDSLFLVDHYDEGGSWYPGYKYSYSNLGTAFLGEVVKRISGVEVEKYITQNILTPLDMKDTHWSKSEIEKLGKLDRKVTPYIYDKNKKWVKNTNGDVNGYGYSAVGYLYSTVENMLKWGDLQLSMHYNQINSVLSPFSLHEMQANELIWGKSKLNGGRYLTCHNGSVVNESYSMFAVEKCSGLSIVSFTNTADTSVDTAVVKAIKKLEHDLPQCKNHKARFIEVKDKVLDSINQTKKHHYRGFLDLGLYSILGSDKVWDEQFQSLAKITGKPAKLTEVNQMGSGKELVTYTGNKGWIKLELEESSSEKGKAGRLYLFDHSKP